MFFDLAIDAIRLAAIGLSVMVIERAGVYA